jgi:LPS export ABC transporter protein LptC
MNTNLPAQGNHGFAAGAGLTQRLPAVHRVTLLLVLLVGGLGPLGCTETSDTPGLDRNGDIPDQQFYDYRLIESAGGIKRWVLESERMEKFADQEEVELFDLRMQFFKEGEYFSTLTAERGRANLTTKNLFTWGDVLVVTEDGRQLETEELHYDNERGLIHNDVFDRFTRDGDVMTGIGLEATPDLEYFELKEAVQAEVGDEGATEDGSK